MTGVIVEDTYDDELLEENDIISLERLRLFKFAIELGKYKEKLITKNLTYLVVKMYPDDWVMDMNNNPTLKKFPNYPPQMALAFYFDLSPVELFSIFFADNKFMAYGDIAMKIKVMVLCTIK